ncbi:MAG: penicillin-binding protein activator [Paludibacterium sp.]|nr:penicillin-binding protein activator [Paludibacterium sp.]
MQKLAPLMVGTLLAWGTLVHAQEPDYIIQSNAAPLNPLSVSQTARPAAATPPVPVPQPASAPVSQPAPAPQPAPVPPPQAAPSAPPAVPGAKPALTIGVLLPTDSPDFGEAARVVRAGMDAAAATDGQASLEYVDEEPADLAARYRALVASGARVIVGPLTRPGISAIAAHVTVPTLALNGFEPGLKTNPRLLSLSLIVEGEARQVAHLMRDDGRANPLVVSTADPLSKRLAQAFVDEWRKQTGAAPAVLAWPFTAPMTDTLAHADSVFIAMTPPEAAALKAALPGPLSVYATSQLDTRKPDAALAGIRFIDMPWFLMPEQAQVKRYPRPSAALTMQTERLYALGIDAYRLAVLMAKGKPVPGMLKLSGVTGDLQLGADRQFERVLPLAVMMPDNNGQ